MRRPRKHLEVSTFPFLAVLLCTMGSLILVLLVMDRKAKLAAKQKAESALVRAAEEVQRDVEERRAAIQRKKDEARAAWERQRQGLHERLVLDEKEMQKQIEFVKLRLTEALNFIRQKQEKLASQRKLVDAERIHNIEQEQLLKRAKETAAATAAEESAAAKARVTTTIADVAILESLLAERKAARSREGQTCSIVPYRGKQGDDRRPIYIECTPRGIIFHPDRKELISPLKSPEVRAEVDRVAARHAEAIRPAAAKDDRPPYCLLLVRPDGIAPYYDLQPLLRNLRIDFGYEFIDSDWVLDFPEDDLTPSKTWAAGADSGPALLPVPTPPPGTAIKGLAPTGPDMMGGPPVTAPGRSEPSGQPVAPGTGATGMGGTAGPRIALSGPTPPGTIPGIGGPAWQPGTPGTGDTGTGRTSVQGVNMRGGPVPPGMVPGSGGPAWPPGTPGTVDMGTGGTSAQGVNMQGGPVPPGTVPGSGGPALLPSAPGTADMGPGGTLGQRGGVNGPSAPGTAQQPVDSRGGTGAQNSGGTGDPTRPGATGSTQAGAGQPSTTSTGEPRPPGQQAPTTGTAQPGAPGQPQPPGQQSPSAGTAQTGAPGQPSTTQPGDPQQPGQQTPTPGGPAAAGQARAPGSPQTGAPGADSFSPNGQPKSAVGAGDGMQTPGLASPLNRFRPLSKSSGGDREPPARRPARLNDRDWILYVECRAEGVILYPSQREFPLAAVTAPPAVNTLLATVQQMIERRQAALPPSDVPFRPQVRFLIRPNSLRTFHMTYPILEALPVPKTRQNLAADDDVRSVME